MSDPLVFDSSYRVPEDVPKSVLTIGATVRRKTCYEEPETR